MPGIVDRPETDASYHRRAFSKVSTLRLLIAQAPCRSLKRGAS